MLYLLSFISLNILDENDINILKSGVNEDEKKNYFEEKYQPDDNALLLTHITARERTLERVHNTSHMTYFKKSSCGFDLTPKVPISSLLVENFEDSPNCFPSFAQYKCQSKVNTRLSKTYSFKLLNSSTGISNWFASNLQECQSLSIKFQTNSSLKSGVCFKDFKVNLPENND